MTQWWIIMWIQRLLHIDSQCILFGLSFLISPYIWRGQTVYFITSSWYKRSLRDTVGCENCHTNSMHWTSETRSMEIYHILVWYAGRCLSFKVVSCARGIISSGRIKWNRRHTMRKTCMVIKLIVTCVIAEYSVTGDC